MGFFLQSVMYSTNWSFQPTQATNQGFSQPQGNYNMASPSSFVEVSGGSWNPKQVSSPSHKKSSPKPEDFRKPNSLEGQLAQQSLYKTELCRSFEETGSCRYGTKCQFAHGKGELRPILRHPKYKTEICKTFFSSGSCPYGKRCRFIHSTLPLANESASPARGNGVPMQHSPQHTASPMFNTSPVFSSNWGGQEYRPTASVPESPTHPANYSDYDNAPFSGFASYGFSGQSTMNDSFQLVTPPYHSGASSSRVSESTKRLPFFESLAQ